MGAEAGHVSAAVMEDGQGRVLLTRRSDDGDLAGAWEFPGGKREPGETAQQALCRELHEELGIRVRVGARSEEHTSELQSLMRISYAVFCLKKQKKKHKLHNKH